MMSIISGHACKKEKEVMNMTDTTARYLEPTQEAGKALVQRHIVGPVVMLNLLRFRPIADYSTTPHLAPAEPISGEVAYKRYIEYTLPYLEKSGGSLVFLGKGGVPRRTFSRAVGPRDAGASVQRR